MAGSIPPFSCRHERGPSLHARDTFAEQFLAVTLIGTQHLIVLAMGNRHVQHDLWGPALMTDVEDAA